MRQLYDGFKKVDTVAVGASVVNTLQLLLTSFRNRSMLRNTGIGLLLLCSLVSVMNSATRFVVPKMYDQNQSRQHVASEDTCDSCR